ncbi:MAG TPA: Rne/Rng family ribonuclease [Candidatus Krumholzibacteria bacterium]|nr:Rne/Rng family ribonuclease [Candidatus Krumholzibacteria bacterium]HPD72688.1 Rne/Rng family ribonuclease [Candidatus Krumholzibacteria bacterium]HRY40380.1 Rne/Rng family ribonuclease [Candidatus Krumholzibacteria bacterium]
MRKDIIINSTPHAVRVAILEDGEVVELLIERAEARRIVGNLYKGKVTSVKPGLQAAFVDIGMEKAGFLHASDIVHGGAGDDVDEDDEEGEDRRRGRGEPVPDIADMLKVGDDIVVQVTKEPISTKGPRLTADLSLPGRYLVMMPKGRHVGVSRKIADRRERVRLKQFLQQHRPDKGAFIIRTAAEGANEDSIRNDVRYLDDLMQKIREKAAAVTAPALVHEDVGLVVGLIRDVFKEDVEELILDDREDQRKLVEYARIFAPELEKRIRLYHGDLPIFDHYDIEAELKKSLEKRVWMKKGGYLIVEPTEALVSIDVNTGRFTGRHNQEDTILQTNLLAAREVARQLRLRDIGGIIVIDFIDMENEANKRRVLQELRNHLKRDRARNKVFSISGLGLVEMSRQRVRPSLLSQLSDPCPYCTGTGKVMSLETQSNSIERLVHRIAIVTKERRLQIQANPMLALFLLEERSEHFRELCRSFDLELNVMDDPGLHVEEFKIVSLETEKDLIAEFEKKAKGQRRH